MVKIRLALGGSKKRPFYYIVVTDSRNARDSKFIERIGFFNSMKSSSDKKLFINFERIQYWLNNGAQPSDRVCALIKKNNLFKIKK